MIRTELITKETNKDDLAHAVHMKRAFLSPVAVNDYVWIVAGGRPTKVTVTDIAVGSIQLQGRWYTWDEAIEAYGGVFETEFDALAHMTG